MRRAAVSVPANIAEGRNRRHTAEFVQFLAIGRGSLSELETYIEIAGRLGYLTQLQVDDLFVPTCELGPMLNGLIHALSAKRR